MEILSVLRALRWVLACATTAVLIASLLPAQLFGYDLPDLNLVAATIGGGSALVAPVLKSVLMS